MQIISAFLIAVAAFAGTDKPWFDRVRELADESSPEHSKILIEMKADKKLEPQVCASIKERKYLNEAFQAVLNLHYQSCWSDVMKAADQDNEWMAVIVLEQLHKEKPRAEWPTWLKNTLTGKKWASIDGSSRLTVLGASALEQIQLTPAELKSLLKDEDSEVREAVLQLVFHNVEANDTDSKEILRHSLTEDPLQFRMAAFRLVGRLPASIRSQYKKDIDRCVKSETENRVKSVCEKLQSSH